MGMRVQRFAALLKPLVVAGAIATLLVALWLCFVIVAVLPSRDPARVPSWAGIAAAFFAYAALTLAFVARGPRPLWLGTAVYWGSVAAVAFGAYEIYAMAWAERTGAHFEGYLLLMGVILVAQGLCASAYTALTVLIARRLRGSVAS